MATTAEPAGAPGPGRPKTHWRNSLRFRMYFRFFAIIAIMVGATFIVMMKAGRAVLHEYAFRYTEQMGNTLVAEIGQQIAQTELLAQGIAHMVSSSVRTGADVAHNVEIILSGLGYTNLVVGAEVWLEPDVTPADMSRVLIWRTNEQGTLEQRPLETSSPIVPSWYPIARQVPAGRIFWSETVVYPRSTRVGMKGFVPIFANGDFLGVVVLDIDLSQLRPLLVSQPDAAGYAFAVDRNNKPLFALNELRGMPASLNEIPSVSSMLERIDERTSSWLVMMGPQFQSLKDALLPLAGVSEREADVVSAMLLDTLGPRTEESKLLLRQPVENAPIVDENAQVFVFHVPRTYWKLVMVKPESAIMAPTRSIAAKILALLVIIMVVPLATVFLLLRRDFMGPVRHMSRSLMGLSDTQGDLLQGLGGSAVNELVELAYAFNRRTDALRNANLQLRREIEGRVRTENALRESEARFRNVLENTRDLLYKLNLRARQYEYVSPASLEVTGFTPDELVGMGADEIVDRIHPDDRAAVRSHFRQLLGDQGQSRASLQIEYRWRHKNGSYIWASEHRTLVRNERGEAVALIGSTRDVTERKKVEREFGRIRRYLQSMIDSMPSVLVGVDGQCIVTHWNREATRVTGIDAQDTLGKPFQDVYPLREDLMNRVCGAVTRGEPLESERFKARVAEGEDRNLELIVFPLLVDGGEGAVIRIDDVTSRAQIEEMMVQTEKMMSVGGLAAGMAHEINNPLGGILQACQNIERRTSPDLAMNTKIAEELGTSIETIRDYMERRKVLEFIRGIRSDGTRAAKIIADMLAFSRRSESKFAPVSFPNLVDTVIRLAANDYDLKKHYDFKRIKIIKDFDPELEMVRCDRTKLEQVLLNLIKNSAQAMAFAEQDHTDPTLTIRSRKEKDYARIEIADNGPGMDEKTRRRAFEPFFTTKEVGVGTGLGLSVSYFIITKQHKGMMSVESAPGKGAKFIIRLPLELEE